MIQTVQLVDPLLLRRADLIFVGGLIPLQQLFQTGQRLFGVRHHGNSVHFQALEFGNIDVDEFAGVLEQPLGGGGEVGVAGADADDQIGFPGDLVGCGAAGGAYAAQIQRMLPVSGGFARLGLAIGDAEGFGKVQELGVGLGIADATAADHHGTLRLADGLGSVSQSGLGGGAALQTPDALGEEAHGIIIGLTLNVLRHGHADSAGVGGVGQHPEGVDHGAHQLFGTDDAIPVPADCLECIVGGGSEGVGVLHLLKHGIRLAAGVGIAGQHQQGDVVGGGGAAGGDHVGGAGANGGGGNADLLTLHLLGESNGGLGHALLILALIDLQVPGFLTQRLPKPHHVAVAGNDEHAADEAVLSAVNLHVLIFQKTHQSLRHGQTDSFHAFVTSDQ